MEYISHEDFKSLMGKFQKETPKGVLKEAVEEGNAFTAALAKTKKGEKAKVDGKEITDTSGYDDPSVKESGYADQYPGAWPFREDKITEDVEVLDNLSSREYKIKRPDGQVVDVYFDDVHVEEMIDAYGASGWISGEDNDGNEYVMSADLVDMGGGDWDIEPDYSTIEFHSAKSANEGLHMPPLQATGPTIDTVEEDMFKLPVRKDTSVLDYDPDASRFEPDYMKTPGEDDDDDDDDNFDLDGDDFDISSTDELPKQFRKTVTADKARYPFLRENSISNPPFGFDVLSPDERKQLEEYIQSIKTIKQEIAKLTSKAGKKVKEGDLGGNRTDLVMTPSVTSEADSHDKIEQIEEKIPEKLYSASVLVIKQLRKAKLTDAEIIMFLKHEMEEEAKKAIMSQHDH